MNNTIKKVLVSAFLAVSFFIFAPATQVNAQIGICDFIEPICNAIGIDNSSEGIGVTAENFVTQRLSLLIGLMFVGITLLAIFIIVQAGIKYIQSQGNEEKIQDAQKAIKSVFIGLAVLIVGVVGVILVIVFLGGGSGFFGLNDNQSCFDNCRSAGFAGSQCIVACQDGNYTNDGLAK